MQVPSFHARCRGSASGKKPTLQMSCSVTMGRLWPLKVSKAILEPLEEAVDLVMAVNIEHDSVGDKSFAELIQFVLKCPTADVAMKVGS